MKCQYLHESNCYAADSVCSIPIPVDDSTCDKCKGKDFQVAYLNAIGVHHKQMVPVPRELKLMMTNKNASIRLAQTGVGTELKKLISWLILTEDGHCKGCTSREIKMNMWGPEDCKRRKPTIRRWLKHSAMKKGLPYSEKLVNILIDKAIKKATHEDSNIDLS